MQNTSLTPKAPSYQLVNMGPEFKQYVETFRNQSAENRWIGWLELESKYFEIFKAGIGDPAKYENLKKAHLEKLFKALPDFEKNMWELFEQAEIITKTQITKFKSVFPDLQDGISIVFMPSLSFFNGQAEENRLFVGVDMVSERNDDINILFSHEFFHIYHFEKLKNKKLWKTMTSPLWTEGMATWVSMHLNPYATYEVALMDKELAQFSESLENIKKMATEYHPISQGPFESDIGKQATAEWFMTSTRIPNRQGYGLGTHIVNEISKSLPVADMAALDEDAFALLVDEALIKLRAQ